MPVDNQNFNLSIDQRIALQKAALAKAIEENSVDTAGLRKGLADLEKIKPIVEWLYHDKPLAELVQHKVDIEENMPLLREYLGDYKAGRELEFISNEIAEAEEKLVRDITNWSKRIPADVSLKQLEDQQQLIEEHMPLLNKYIGPLMAANELQFIKNEVAELKANSQQSDAQASAVMESPTPKISPSAQGRLDAEAQYKQEHSEPITDPYRSMADSKASTSNSALDKFKDMLHTAKTSISNAFKAVSQVFKESSKESSKPEHDTPQNSDKPSPKQ